MHAKLKPLWVRKLIGKLGVPYNRRLGVRDSSHPFDYETGLSSPAAEINAFRIHSVLPRPNARIVALSDLVKFSGRADSYKRKRRERPIRSPAVAYWRGGAAAGATKVV